MDHIHYEFDAEPGDVIEVGLDRAANVQLMDSDEYKHYKAREFYRYFGGHATRSPVRLKVPRAGQWHVVIDLGGGFGQVRATARLISGAVA